MMPDPKVKTRSDTPSRQDPDEVRRDRQRLKRLALGEVAAHEELYDIHAKRLFGLALWLTRRSEDAEEVVQTVMVKLAGRGQELLSIRMPAAYLVSMARREALDIVTRRGSHREEPWDESLFEESGSHRDGASPLDALQALPREDAIAVETALSALPPEQREVVYLHVYEGWSFREIGEAIAVPTFTAASRYRLALERLREQLGEQAKEIR